MPISGFDEGVPGENPNYGWNRATIQYKSRKPSKPEVSTDDLLTPNGLGNLRMLRACALMAGMMTVLYVWIPLILLTFFIGIGGLTYGIVMGGALLAITAWLYLAGTRETRRDRKLASRL